MHVCVCLYFDSSNSIWLSWQEIFTGTWRMFPNQLFA